MTALLRRIETRDNARIAQVIREVLTSFGACGPGFAIHDAEVDDMRAAYEAPRHAYFVIEDAGDVLGGGGIAPLAGGDGSTCELRKMYLFPHARGQGHGERLLRECLAFAREANFRTCYLETLTHMTAAQALYKKFGFAPIETRRGATGHFGCDRFYALSL